MTTEEVILRMGFDSTALKSGMGGAHFLVENSVKKSLESLKNLVAVNAVSMGLQLVDVWSDVSKTVATEFWDGWYSSSNRMTEITRKALRDTVELAQKAREKFKEASLDFELFAVGDDDEKKLEVLNRRKVEAQEKQAKAEKELAKLQEGMAWAVAMDDRAEQTRKIGAKEAEINLLLVKSLEIEKEIGTVERSREKESEKARQKEERFQEKKRQQAKQEESQRKTLSEASGNLYDFQRGRREFTIEEMASADFMKRTRWGRQAQQILRLQQWSKENAMLGFTQKSDWQQSRADKLMADLQKANPYLKDPQKELKEAMDKNWEKLEQIRIEGLHIKPEA